MTTRRPTARLGPVDVIKRTAALVDAWCERRALRALREILSAWPLTTGLTDELADLGEALKRVRALASTELTDSERKEVERLIAATEQLALR